MIGESNCPGCMLSSHPHYEGCPHGLFPNAFDNMMKSSTPSGFVLQPWVSKVGLKMQSILLSGLRAPDTKTAAVKKCVRWMRSNCQIDADPNKQSYMQTVTVDKKLVDQAMEELEYLPVHYAHHFADAFRVMALFHPDAGVKLWAYQIHYLVAEELFHFKPESDKKFLDRHRDKIEKELS